MEVDRPWQTGDQVSLVLPKALHLEPLPDNPRRAAILWGPLVLAGDLGPEDAEVLERDSLNGEFKVPVFVAAERPVAEWLKPVPDRPGQFRTDGVGREQDVDFLPFYRLHRRTYAVYWDLFTPDEWEQEKVRVRGPNKSARASSTPPPWPWCNPARCSRNGTSTTRAGTTPSVVRLLGRPGRRAANWFSFDLPVEPGHPGPGRDLQPR